MRPGSDVEVRSRFDGGWVAGFQVAGIESNGLTLRRISDGAVLPVCFRRDEVRARDLDTRFAESDA